MTDRAEVDILPMERMSRRSGLRSGARALLLVGSMTMAATLSHAQQAPPTAARANSYDDAWEQSWVAHTRQVLAA